MNPLHYLTVLIVSLVPMAALADNTEWRSLRARAFLALLGYVQSALPFSVW
jgi:hypothetical protein